MLDPFAEPPKITAGRAKAESLDRWKWQGWSMADEEALRGGNLSAGIVRVGGTVHRPTGPWTPAVHSLLRHLEQVGFQGAPRVYGFDTTGREVVEFVAGEVPWPEPHRRLLGGLDAMRRVGALLRSFHDAVASFPIDPEAVWRFPEMAADSEPFVDERGIIVCHNDPAAWNLVVGRDRWALVDWDAAGPRPPLWDVAYCAIGVVPITSDVTLAGWAQPPPYLPRLQALCDGYGLTGEERARLPEVIVARVRSSYQHLRRRAAAGIAPWDELWRNGHGDAWLAMLHFAEANQATWTAEIAT
jgi:hypothetical protein